MRPRAPTLVAAGQVAFVVLLGVCVARRPGLVAARNEGGVSNYGIHRMTVVPYSLAFASAAATLALAARRLASGAVGLRRVLTVQAALLLATAVTTYGYHHGVALKDVHFVVGAALLVFEGASGWWLWRASSRGVGATGSLVVLGAGLVACVLASVALWHVLFAGQVLVTAGDAPLLVAAARRA
jgi:hypothetical protein